MSEYIEREELRIDDPEYNILVENDDYLVYKKYETVRLYMKKQKQLVWCIGDFYGDAEGAIITEDNQWCIMYGCGIIAYRLKEPFDDYSYDTVCEQWSEFRRGPKDILWVEKVVQTSPTSMLVISEDESKYTLDILDNHLKLERFKKNS